MPEIESLLVGSYLLGFGWLLFKSLEVYDETLPHITRDLIWAAFLAIWPIIVPIAIFRSKDNEGKYANSCGNANSYRA